MKTRNVSEHIRKNPVFEGINPKELEKPIPEPFWRKPLIAVVGIFLVALIVSLSFSDVFQSIVQSRIINNNRLMFLNATVLFENNTLELLQNEFVSNEHREIKACLFGRNENGLYYIERVEFPEIVRANVIHVVSVQCPIDTLIDLHSHPINQCLASEQDIAVYEQNKKNNPSLRMMVMCSSERFALV